MTKTYYHRSTARPIGAVSAQFENALELSTGTAANQQATGLNQNAALAWAAATPASEPNSAAWPSGTYRYQLDVPSVSVDLIFGLLTLDSALGGFLRLDSTLAVVLERVQQSQGAFSLSGLHLATVSWTPLAGLASDRFGFAVAVDRVDGHGNTTMTMQLNEADDFADGPWAASPAAAPDAVFFGTNF